MKHSEKEQQQRLQHLIDMEVDHNLPPEHRLLLAVLRQAFLDYFGEEPVERQSAAEYFALSPLYRLTLNLLEMPDDMLPAGIEPAALQEALRMNDAHDLETLRMETLVRQLSGSQLKVVLTMGLLSLPASAGKIAAGCQISRTAVTPALLQLLEQGLVERHDRGTHQFWSLPPAVAELLNEVWGG